VWVILMNTTRIGLHLLLKLARFCTLERIVDSLTGAANFLHAFWISPAVALSDPKF